VDVRAAQILVRRGKGGHARLVATGDRATLATSRWIRVRRRHTRAGEPALFLSTRPDASGSWRLTPGAVAVLLTRRCAQAGVPPITPHQLRHLWAHSLAASGVRETEMTILGGWSPRSDMPRRYGAALAAERALAAQRANSPGDRL
jgi:site-specific recombinase XerD